MYDTTVGSVLRARYLRARESCHLRSVYWQRVTRGNDARFQRVSSTESRVSDKNTADRSVIELLSGAEGGVFFYLFEITRQGPRRRVTYANEQKENSRPSTLRSDSFVLRYTYAHDKHVDKTRVRGPTVVEKRFNFSNPRGALEKKKRLFKRRSDTRVATRQRSPRPFRPAVYRQMTRVSLHTCSVRPNSDNLDREQIGRLCNGGTVARTNNRPLPHKIEIELRPKLINIVRLSWQRTTTPLPIRRFLGNPVVR